MTNALNDQRIPLRLRTDAADAALLYVCAEAAYLALCINPTGRDVADAANEESRIACDTMHAALRDLSKHVAQLSTTRG